MLYQNGKRRMSIEELSNLNSEKAFEEFLKCCGSTSWANKLSEIRPFNSIENLLNSSDAIWLNASKQDGLEACKHHPKIGDLKNLGKKFASTKDWAGSEQAGVSVAANQTIIALAEGNLLYEKKFGYIFIVCATGKTADEMLALLNDRLPNDSEVEFKIAMNEQNKITHIRLKKLLA